MLFVKINFGNYILNSCMVKEFYNIFEHQHALLSKIRIVDNVFSDYDSELSNEIYGFESLNDTMRDGGYIGADREFPIFGEKLLNQSNIILGSIGYGKVTTLKTEVLIVSDMNSAFKNSRHLDDTANNPYGYTLSYHWMGENNAGGTSFYSDFKEEVPYLNVPFKQNRLVIFPASIPHEGYANPGYKLNSKRVIYTLFVVLEEFT